MALIALALMTASLGAAVQAEEPWKRGLVQCYDANPERKTCRAIGAYRQIEDGSVINDATNMVSREPVVIFRASNPVYDHDGMSCSAIVRMEPYITGVEVDGRALEGESLERAKTRIADNMERSLGTSGEYCTREEPQPDGTVFNRVTINGAERPQASGIVPWVDPAEGWRVAP